MKNTFVRVMVNEGLFGTQRRVIMKYDIRIHWYHFLLAVRQPCPQSPRWNTCPSSGEPDLFGILAEIAPVDSDNSTS